MKDQIENEIQKFNDVLKGGIKPYLVTELCQHAYQISPKIPNLPPFPNKEIPLMIMAVTHGNEVGGIAVLNKLIELLAEGLIQINYPLVLALGNPWASVADKRFLERDLNRSFNRSSSESLEDRRARELEPILERVAFLVDIHQTIESSDRPFFIFPYQKSSYEFARLLADDVAIVTHWGGGFSKDGACTDEYVNLKQGTGLTIELGQKGFHPYQEGIGLRVVLQAMSLIQKKLKGETVALPQTKPEIYTWAEVIPFPEGKAGLDEGWYNFQWIEKNQKIGFSEQGSILAPCSGPILFPKYIRASSGPQKPKEICRIMKPVSEEQLGH